MKACVIHAPHDLRIDEVAASTMGPDDVTVRIRAGGICGSDLHYFHAGGFGAVRIQQPMILGHEIAGSVTAIGSGVGNVAVGDVVAVNPSLACGMCQYCLAGQPHHCLDMRFYGSAMRFPHVQGGFREELVCHKSQAVKTAMPAVRAAFAEPLSVCLHAAKQAGPMLGARVLVTGAGPIGALCAMVARHAGAREIVATDLLDAPLAIMRKVGVDRTINMRHDAGALELYSANKGNFDVAFECSGAGPALSAAFGVVRPGAVIVQVGLGGDVVLPMNTLVAKEINLRGTFRFHEEFVWAVRFLESGALDVSPLLTEIVPLADATRAFELASNRAMAMKVQLAF
jgi:L-idonate 5-dehydrogenase